MRIVLMGLGWALLALVALLLLALVLPARAAIEYREGALSVQLRLLGIQFHVYPFPEGLKRRSPPAHKPKKKKSGKRGRRAGKKPMFEWDDLQGILGMAGAFTRRALRAIRITDIILIVPVHRDNAAETALACGRSEAWLSGVAAALQNFMELRWTQLRVLPDFTGEITAGFYLSCRGGARPVSFLIAGVHAFLYLLKKDDPPPARAGGPVSAGPHPNGQSG